MSLLKEAFEKGNFAVTAEMAPPKGTDLSHLIECANKVKGSCGKCYRFSICYIESYIPCHL